MQGHIRSILHNTLQESILFVPSNLIEVFRNDDINEKLIANSGYNIEESRLFINHLLERGFLKEQISLVNENSKRNNEKISGDAILECMSHVQIESILKQLMQLSIYSISIIYRGSLFISLLDELEKCKLKYIEILVDGKSNIKMNQNLKLRVSNIRALKKIVFFGQKENACMKLTNNVNLIWTQTQYNHKLCGKIEPKNFILNKQSFLEAKNHNSCLYRKISVDAEGNIKNCPSMKGSFGNIKNTTLAEAIEKPSFKKYWNINKDKIHVCKDCEFRYICTDCRAYVEDPEDIHSKPLKCGYNPYTGEWSEWSTNPLKQTAIDYYEMRELVNEMNQGESK